jgi:GNAT superfamily N-acetyltransferase
VNVRLVRRTDAEALTRLSGELGYTTSDTEVRIRLGAILAHPDHAAFVAEHPDLGLLGWIHVFASLRIESGSFAEIGGLVVMEAQRRTGVGQALVEVAEQWTWERGLTMLRVRTNVNRSEAHDFYRKLDFREIKTQKVFVKELQ